MKAMVFINEQHKLLPEQKKILDMKYWDNWELFSVPAEGWTLKEIDKIAETFQSGEIAIFVSPIPALISRLAFSSGAWSFEESINHQPDSVYCGGVWVFHNDHRVSKEVPDGKGGVRIIKTVAPTGWQLV
jgi:hypothetical protein